jgi:hypothetical protein
MPHLRYLHLDMENYPDDMSHKHKIDSTFPMEHVDAIMPPDVLIMEIVSFFVLYFVNFYFI